MLLSTSFMAKNDLVFLLLEEKLIHRGFILKPTKKKAKFSLKTLMEIFTIGTLQDWHVHVGQSLKILNVFISLT